jgi:TatD DNase family protein
MIDTHAHLDFPQFDKDRKEVIRKAKQEGIIRIINIGVDLESSRKSVELAEEYDEIYATVGFHPHDADKLNLNSLKEIKRLAQHPKVVGIGEIGLDFYRNLSPKETQIQAFKDQIKLALDVNKPIAVHIRNAWDQGLSILQKTDAKKVGGVLHCFTGNLDQTKKGLDLGFYLSFNGTLTYHKSKSAELVRKLPLDFILTETDCPYLTPFPHRGKRNEPSYVKLVGEKLAQLFSPLTYQDIERTTTVNAQKLFGLNVKFRPKIAYLIRNSLYLNLTNDCTNSCTFCVRFYSDFVKGHYLRLDHEPNYQEVIQAMGDFQKFDEVVFCGFGEPTLRLDLLKRIAKHVKEKGVKTRLNTNGEGNLIHKRNVVPELAGLIDVASVSLNVDTSEKYDKICKSKYGRGVFYDVIDFIKECKKLLPETVVTVLDLPETDFKKCEEIAKNLDVKLRKRHYKRVG